MKPKSQAKNKTATLAAALVLSAPGALPFSIAPAHAQNGPTGLALAQQQNCMSCHSMTRTFMGPPLHDIAAKYAGKPEAQTYLAHKIMEGSTGVWGPVPMPANTQLNPGQAAVLANWILTLK